MLLAVRSFWYQGLSQRAFNGLNFFLLEPEPVGFLRSELLYRDVSEKAFGGPGLILFHLKFNLSCTVRYTGRGVGMRPN